MSSPTSPLLSRYRALSGQPGDFQLDANGQPIDPSASDPANLAFDPSGFSGATTQSNIYGDTSGGPSYPGGRDDSIGAQVNRNQGFITQGGQQINNEAASQLGYYGPRQQQYDKLQDTALEQLNQTPGYTGDEASKIGVDYSQFNTGQDDLSKQFMTPEEQAAATGDPNGVRQVAQNGTDAENVRLGQYGENLSGQLGNYSNYTKGALDSSNTGVTGAVGGLKTGLSDAQGKFSGLDKAVSDPGLAFDPNSTEQQLSNGDVQQMKTAAGTRVGNQYQSAEDQLYRNAAAAGNTSPMALAAANARLQHQESADQGDAETNADIAARQAQFQRASDIEQQREGAVGRQVGLKAGAATTEEAAAQAAAGLGGTQDIGASEFSGAQGINAAEKVGQAGLDVANQYGQTAIGEQNTITGQDYNAANTSDQTAAARAAQLAVNRQQTQQNVNNTRYSQDTGSAAATSAGATNVGQTRIAGQGSYRSGVAGQQGAAQQGGQTAVAQQNQVLNTEASGVNQGTSTLSNYKVAAPTVVGQATGMISALMPRGLAKGGIVSEPEVAVVGEKGPEMIVPLGRYRPDQRRAA